MRRFTILLICMLAFTPTSLFAQDALPSDLALVPPDTGGFVHVRLPEIWKSPHFKEIRDTVLMAGDDVLAAFDARYFPRPSSVERLTIIMDAPTKEREEQVVFVLATGRVIDKASFMKFTVPGAVEEREDGKTFLVDAKKRLEIFFVDSKTLAFGPPGAVRRLLTRPRVARGNLSEAIQLASAGRPIVAAINHDVIPREVLAQVPPPLQPLLDFKVATLTLDFVDEGHARLGVIYPNAGKAGDALTAAREGIKLGRKYINMGRAEIEKKVVGDGKPGTLDQLPEAAGALVLLGALNRLDDYLAELPLMKTGNTLSLAVKLPQGAQALTTLYGVSGAVAYFLMRSQRVEPPQIERPAPRQ